MTDTIKISRELLERIPLQLLIDNGYNQTAAGIRALLERPNSKSADGIGFDYSIKTATSDSIGKPTAPADGVYSTDPLACSGCASGCFRCLNAPADGEAPDVGEYYAGQVSERIKELEEELAFAKKLIRGWLKSSPISIIKSRS